MAGEEGGGDRDDQVRRLIREVVLHASRACHGVLWKGEGNEVGLPVVPHPLTRPGLVEDEGDDAVVCGGATYASCSVSKVEKAYGILRATASIEDEQAQEQKVHLVNTHAACLRRQGCGCG